VQVPHHLPLGIAEDGSYAGTQMQLPENGTLAFVSDGVVEAKTAAKNYSVSIARAPLARNRRRRL